MPTSPTPIPTRSPFPLRSTTPDQATYNTDVETWGGEEPAHTDAMNNIGTNVYNNAVEAKSSAVSAAYSESIASASADSASSSASYKGPWPSLTGALNIPASVGYNSKTWRLENNLVDVTLSEPGVSGDWTDITAVTPSGNNTFTGSNTFAEISEGEFTITGTVIDPANGAFQTKTFTSVEVLTESMTNGQTVRLELIDADTYPPTLPSGTWYTGKGDGVAPALKSKHRIALEKVGGALYYYDLGSTV